VPNYAARGITPEFGQRNWSINVVGSAVVPTVGPTKKELNTTAQYRLGTPALQGVWDKWEVWIASESLPIIPRITKSSVRPACTFVTAL